jgi:hypothetical protein
LDARFSEAMFLANLATWQKKRRIEERYKKDISFIWMKWAQFATL